MTDADIEILSRYFQASLLIPNIEIRYITGDGKWVRAKGLGKVPDEPGPCLKFGDGTYAALHATNTEDVVVLNRLDPWLPKEDA